MAELITYSDIDIYGREKADGTPYTANNEEAIKTAFTLWLTSKAGDFLRNPDAGGILDRILFKNMYGKSIGLFLFGLKNAITKYFTPALTVLDTKIERDYQYRTLKIIIIYIVQDFNNIQQVEVLTKDIKTVSEQEEQTIPYTGYNLRMFCLIRQADMENELLVYNSDEEKWRWGKYLFSNFSTSDEYYNEILSITNGT